MKFLNIFAVTVGTTASLLGVVHGVNEGDVAGSTSALDTSIFERKLWPDRGNVCENDEDPATGMCKSKPTCTAIVTRQKRIRVERCLDEDTCGHRVVGYKYELFPGAVEEKEFQGRCDVRPLPTSGEWDCECLLDQQTEREAQEWMNAPPPPPECGRQKCTGLGHGEPHFKAFDGSKYNYQGECDLVATSSPSFGSNTGLDLHIRTTIDGSTSYISAAALKIGADTFEVDVQNNLYYNGAAVTDQTLPPAISGYTLTVDIRAHIKIYCIWLNDCEVVYIIIFMGMLRVEVHAVLPDATGMFGTWGTPGMIGRNGAALADPNLMGQDWQVQGADPTIFTMNRAPASPQVCVLPPPNSRRLGEESARAVMAETACAGLKDADDMEDCIFDVVETGNADMALAYMAETYA